MFFTRARLLITAIGILMATGSAWAQPLGNFRWQQQPYCNILTLNVVGEGGNYTLDGSDDLCGASQKASVNGIAYQNPDGTIGFGLTIVGPPGGAVHITATINLVTLGGTWSDSNGNTGLFVFTPGAGVPGSARPATFGNPTRVTHSYDLMSGATSPPITVPANIPVSLMGTQMVVGFRGIAHASLLSIPGAGGFIEWVGIHSTNTASGAATTYQGFSGTPGTLILYIDWGHCVRVEVAGSAGSSEIQVRNTCFNTRAGLITLTY
ncbi:MAG TPA: hypothetical protein VMO26_28790 [Vicinamibacterales bacterium]|nr:hypothetical protein [Vicinamibacterales bacterium]